MGKLFVIDGTDGSGKQTQLGELKNRLDRAKMRRKWDKKINQKNK